MLYTLFLCLVMTGQGASTIFAEDNAQAQEQMISSLILVDESAIQVLDVLSQLTGKRVLSQQDLPKVKINFNSRGPISKKNAVVALESLLAMNGIAVVDMGGDFLKAVPAATVSSESPDLFEGSTLTAEPSQKIYSKIFNLKYLSTKEAQSIIKNITTAKVSTQTALESNNSLFITDTLANLQRIETLLNLTDKPLALQDEILFLPVRYLNVDDVKKRFESMQKGNLKKYLSGTTFEADTNSNQLIVLTHPDNASLIKDLLSKLDVDVAPINRTEVFNLKHANAKDVTALLKDLVKDQSSQASRSTANQPTDARQALLERLGAAASGQSSSSESSQTEKFSTALSIEADERSNAIVAFGTPRDLQLVSELITKLDVLLAQVRIEVVIAEVKLDNDHISALSTFQIQHGLTQTDTSQVHGKNILKNVTSLTTTNIASSAFQIAGSLKPFTLDSIIRVAHRDSNVRILSAPMIVTTHNQKATIKVVTEQPYAAESSSSTDSTNTIRSTTKYIDDVGIVLEVTPLIGPNNVIQMEITQKVRSLGANVPITSNQTAVAINSREATSFVSAADQEIIVLGGLQQRDTKRVKEKMWLFGHLPVVGNLLFSPKTDVETATELIMFIKPYIVNNARDMSYITNQELETSRAEQPVRDYFDKHRFVSVREEECRQKMLNRSVF